MCGRSWSFAFGFEDVGEEVVAFVIDDDDGGEIDDFDFADGFHAEFFKVDDFVDHFLRSRFFWGRIDAIVSRQRQGDVFGRDSCRRCPRRHTKHGHNWT